MKSRWTGAVFLALLLALAIPGAAAHTGDASDALDADGIAPCPMHAQAEAHLEAEGGTGTLPHGYGMMGMMGSYGMMGYGGYGSGLYGAWSALNAVLFTLLLAGLVILVFVHLYRTVGRQHPHEKRK